MALRSRLFVLAASGLLPLALVVMLALAYLVHEQEQATQRSALALSRALATAVEAELNSTVAVLRALSQNEQMQRGDFEQFYRSSVRVVVQQGWRGIGLADEHGTVIFRTLSPFGTGEPSPADPESMKQALAAQRPVVGAVMASEGPRGVAFAVRLPFRTEGNRLYVLTAVLATEQILNVLKRQSIPPSWVVGVFDPAMQRVARSRESAMTRASPSLQAMLQEGRAEGVGVATTVEGVKSHTGFTRLADSGWVVAVAIPAAEAAEGTAGPALAMLLGLLGSLALAGYMGWYFARRVSEPIEVLKEAAAALGRGEQVRSPPLDITELDEVARALVQASRQREAFMAELTRGQAEREALLAQVTEALRTAQEAARTKDEFLAVLGHELRNPLAPISMALQLIARKGEESTAKERRIIERQVAHMTRLVDDLLDLSRITGKRLTMRQEPLRLVDVVRHSADAARPLLHGRRLRVDIPAEAEQAFVCGDDARLMQVFNNLLGNAVKFTGNDGEIAVAMALAGDAVEVSVSDDGLGMSGDVLQHAFEPFFQERQGGDRSRGGLGLGLAIVKSLVEMHGGTVSAHSEGPGRGSRIVVRLPLAAAAAPAGEAQARPAEGGQGRVLVVDDNRDAADMTGALLVASGYEVRVAYGPEDALALVDEFVPDVGVLDIGLPGMSGYELAQRLRERPGGTGCRLLALTGYGRSADVAMALDNGFAVHLAKPAAAEVLLARVRELMDMPSASTPGNL